MICELFILIATGGVLLRIQVQIPLHLHCYSLLNIGYYVVPSFMTGYVHRSGDSSIKLQCQWSPATPRNTALHTLAESVSYFSLDYRSYLPIVYVYLR